MGIILLILGLCIERKIVFWIKRNYVIKFVVNPKSVSFLLVDAFFWLGHCAHRVHRSWIPSRRKKMNAVELKIIENLRIKWISWSLCVENEIKLREGAREQRREKRQHSMVNDKLRPELKIRKKK